MDQLLGYRPVAWRFEEILRGSAKELGEVAKRPGGLKGEMVVLVRAAAEKPKKKSYGKSEEE